MSAFWLDPERDVEARNGTNIATEHTHTHTHTDLGHVRSVKSFNSTSVCLTKVALSKRKLIKSFDIFIHPVYVCVFVVCV